MSEPTPAAEQAELVHECPPTGAGGLTPCCRKTPWELPRTDRMASDHELVTCMTGDDPRLRAVRHG